MMNPVANHPLPVAIRTRVRQSWRILASRFEWFRIGITGTLRAIPRASVQALALRLIVLMGAVVAQTRVPRIGFLVNLEETVRIPLNGGTERGLKSIYCIYVVELYVRILIIQPDARCLSHVGKCAPLYCHWVGF